nr:receptor-like cytosolic serine/threonine-protein kinase RBK2 [Ipomoea trifida]
MEKRKGMNVHSPDTVLEDYLNGLESETDSSKNSNNSELEAHHKEAKSSSKWAGFIQLFRTKSKRHLGSLDYPLNSLKLSKRFSSSMRETASFAAKVLQKNPGVDGEDSNGFKPHWRSFSLSELQTATRGFHQESLIGKGGYAEVHKGCLRDGQLVAVKRLTRGPPEERVGDFLSELGIMAHVDHPNTAKLIGYGVEGGYFLVLELSPHGSLASMMHVSKRKLEWDIRYKVALGTAKGLQYLHEGCRRRIIHRDIKAANILLTKDFEPQICDFGLAKWLPERWTHINVMKFEGTFGYLAPEFLMHGIVDEKTDVFAFGVLLLELITGRRALDYSQQSLVIWAKPLLKKNRIRELADTSLGENYSLLQMNLMALAASLCVQQSSIKRPRISQVLQLLRGNYESLDLIRRCRKSLQWKGYYEELFNAEEGFHKNSNLMSCLSLQEQIAMEIQNG